jgi:hypothetical protein
LYALEKFRVSGNATSRALHPFHQHSGNTLTLDSSTSAVKIVVPGHDPIIQIDIVGLWVYSLESYYSTMIAPTESDDFSFLGESPGSC